MSIPTISRIAAVAVTVMAVPFWAYANFTGKFGDGIFQAEMSAHLPFAPPTMVIVALMRWMLSIVGFLTIIALAYAGILYMTSAGSETQTSTAKKTALYAVLGLIIAIGGLVLITAIDRLLGGNSSF